MKAARLETEPTSSDRITHLPDDLLFRILSFIPVSDAMATSLLSKRWTSLWKMMPTLEYDENSCPNIGSFRYHKFCKRSLELHKGPVLKTLNLKLKNPSSDFLDSHLFPRISSTLLEVTVTSTSTSYPCYNYSIITFPNNLRVFHTVVVLKLQGQILIDVVDSPVCFMSLKTLYLICVNFKREKSFGRLLSSCPVLECLFLQRLCTVGRFLFSISVPSLERLFITKEAAYNFKDDSIIEINAPSLKYLEIKDRRGSFDYVEDMPKLVDAHVAVNLSKTGKFLKALTSAKHLWLDLYPSMVFLHTNRFIANQLLYLELNIYENFQSNLLLSLLKNFPNLQALKLNHTHPNYNTDDQPCLVSKPSSVPECLSFHLETFQWIGYSGTDEDIEVAVYVLKNARCLKNATISLHSMGTENNLMMINELKSMSKASTMCQLVIKS
ncbi:PREDICTED: putative F-box/FBD/LRR-repeat protein At5g56810 [Camelina sativa]|uniref:F-box/FBD/LRR-repeat protein At5g56810 n=1 Tax=Camelina sativa TaxID=90675 RepID=A0ABM0WPZ4_CAMSA|nr:PREDICTED: putative F-box/FBD/LRR-repeat protein At5g56810 [Camelina sativa]